MYQNREEFLEKFKQQQRFNYNTISSTNKSNELNTRWNDLYQLDKRHRSKIEEQKIEKDRINTEKELNECTFAPKLNTPSLSKIKKQTIDNANNPNANSVPYHLTLFARENAWKQKKNNKIETILQSNLTKEMKECMFTPAINNPRSLKQNEFHTQAQSLVVDPESYEQYINRKTKIREREKKEHLREKSIPGTGNIYDKQFSKRNRSSHNLIILNKSNDKMKIQTIRDNNNNIRQQPMKMNTNNSSNNLHKQNDSNGKQILEYDEALRLLHDELFSIQLLN